MTITSIAIILAIMGGHPSDLDWAVESAAIDATIEADDLAAQSLGLRAIPVREIAPIKPTDDLPCSWVDSPGHPSHETMLLAGS